MSQPQKGSDHMARLMYKKLGVVDTHFAAMVEHFDIVLRTGQKMADRVDALSKEFHMFGEEETPGIQFALAQISECFHKIEEHRRSLLSSINDNIITLLKDYEAVNRDMKNEVNEREKLKDKQLAKQKNLERIQTKEPTNTSKIKHAKVDRDVVAGEASQADKLLIDNMIRYQQRKLDDVKGMLRQFILLQMAFHGRSLEILSEAHDHLDTMCPERDIQDLIELRNTTTDANAAAAAASAAALASAGLMPGGTALSASMRSVGGMSVGGLSMGGGSTGTSNLFAPYAGSNNPSVLGVGSSAAAPTYTGSLLSQPPAIASATPSAYGGGVGGGYNGSMSMLSQPQQQPQQQQQQQPYYGGTQPAQLAPYPSNQATMFPQTPMADNRWSQTPGIRPTVADVSDLLDDSRHF